MKKLLVIFFIISMNSYAMIKPPENYQQETSIENSNTHKECNTYITKAKTSIDNELRKDAHNATTQKAKTDLNAFEQNYKDKTIPTIQFTENAKRFSDMSMITKAYNNKLNEIAQSCKNGTSAIVETLKK